MQKHHSYGDGTMKKWRWITSTAVLMLGLMSACGSKETGIKMQEVAAESSVTEESGLTSVPGSAAEKESTEASAPGAATEQEPTEASVSGSAAEQEPTEASTPDSAAEQESIEASTPDSATNGENTYIRIEKCSARADQDYLHVSYDPITLGNGEKLTLTITATPADLRAEDFYISYDSALLSSEITDISSNESGNETIVKAVVTAISPGTSDLYILSSYDLANLPEDEWRGIGYSIKGLDSTDGKIVFVTPTGEKYHFSADCAGENAIGTTLYDAVADEYEPCGRCAS